MSHLQVSYKDKTLSGRDGVHDVRGGDVRSDVPRDDGAHGGGDEALKYHNYEMYRLKWNRYQHNPFLHAKLGFAGYFTFFYFKNGLF